MIRLKCGCGHTRLLKKKKYKGRSCVKCNSAKHNMWGTRIYRIWADMKSRCEDKNHINYHRYGGRGIGYEKDWSIFKKFFNDMKDGYKDELTLDRTDNSRGYSKNNCRWATRKEQANNTCRSRYLEFNKRKLTVSQWAGELGVNRQSIHGRIRLGWSDKDILTIPFKKRSC